MNQSLLQYAFLVLPLLIIADYLRVYFRKGLRHIPGPAWARVSGLYRVSMVYKGDAPRHYRDLHKGYGRIVRTGPNHVSVSDPEMIPIIYGISSKFYKTPFYSTMSPWFEGSPLESLFSTRDPGYHKALKSPVSAIFSMTQMRNFEPYADRCTEIFIKAMYDLKGQKVDLAQWLQWYAFDVIGEITFQRKFGFLEQRKDVDNMIAQIDRGLSYAGIVGQLPAWHPWLLGNRRLLGFLSMFGSLPDPITRILKITLDQMKLYDEEEKDVGNSDFITLLRAEAAKGDGRMSRRDQINHLSNNLLAGSDTTAISLRAIFYYVIKTPRVYQKLVREIDDADQAGALSRYVTYEECLKLPYLQAVMKEALRLHPGVAFPLEREVPVGGALICGVHLPAGTNVGITAPVIHHNRDVFGEDADDFKPERWIDASKEQLKVMDRSFLAFGYGARTCIGKNISILEMGKLVPQIFRVFHIEWASPNPEWKTSAAWFWKQSEVIVKFTPRNLE